MYTRKAMGLVEVLASLFILGAAATAILVAQGVAIEQAKNAASELEAAELAHELIATWRLEGVKRHDSASGRFDRAGWSWRRHSVPKQILENVSVAEVMLEIVCEKGGNQLARQFAWLEKSNAAAR